MFEPIDFKVALKKFLLKGNLVYEYNPFRNYRLDLDFWYYKNEFYTEEELAKELGYESWEKLSNDLKNKKWNDIIPNYETIPQLYLKGLLVDFITDELLFSLENSVNILPTYSYDNSVDLIINDGKSLPKIINSRFSATERNKYLINDRKGDSDTNIYDKGDKFLGLTSLYKSTSRISNFTLLNVASGGLLKVGLHTLYFSYVDDDGNESDIFLESGPILVFIGTNVDSINSGFRDLNSFKLIKFWLKNLDSSYNKIQVYYTRATSDINENPTVSAYKLIAPVNYTNDSIISTLTGIEDAIEIPVEDINKRILRYIASETLEICLNRLFLGHTYKIPQNYKDFRDIALRFCPKMHTKTYTPLKYDFTGDIKNTYYNPVFTYNNTGYWSDFYRFGIVFIQSDGTYSDVYDVRGCTNLTKGSEFSHIPFRTDEGERNYIAWDEESYNIITDNDNVNNENAKGVILFSEAKLCDIIGILFLVDSETLNYLRDDLHVLGFMFVRKKRIPTVLCQAYTIPIDNESNTPILPYKGELINKPAKPFILTGILKSITYPETGILPVTDAVGYSESLLHQYNKTLVNGYKSKLVNLSKELVRNLGAICPDYDVNTPYYNSIFCGIEMPIKPYDSNKIAGYDDVTESRLYDAVISEDSTSKDSNMYSVSILGVEDNVALVETKGYKFSARAGEAEEVNKFKYIGKEYKSEKAVNILRGSYGPYLGIVGFEEAGKLVNIYIPGYSEAFVSDYLKIRHLDQAPYYSISEQFDISKDYTYYFESVLENGTTIYKLREPLYRGDCFICNYAHRLNRNFADPSAPTNDLIVDQNTWKDNFKVEDGIIKTSEMNNINLGDLNAVKLGTYISLVVRSSINLNIRSLDDSYPDELSLTGSPRTFAPNILYSVDGVYKKPEALCYNSGLAKTTSERIFIGLPDVPFFMEDFTNRIAYSDIKIKDSFSNGFRIFKDGNYRDYPKTYGSIIKLVEADGSLYCVLEHGIYKIPVNERAIAAEGSGGMAYINTSNILPENPLTLSDKFGSLWRESVIKTPLGIYGVDTSARKIWRITGDSIEVISDFKILKFLNDNISLTERELTPIIGIRNVKTHYNDFKGDVMFTFYDNLRGFEERVWNICYNERLNLWTTFYSWVPSYSENIQNQYFSFDRNTSKWIAKLGISNHGNAFSDGVTLSNNIIPVNLIPKQVEDKTVYEVGNIYLDNRTLTQINKEELTFFTYADFTLERDNYGNYKNFMISKELFGSIKLTKDKKWDYTIIDDVITDKKLIPQYKEVYLKLYLLVPPTELCSELYDRVVNNKRVFGDNEISEDLLILWKRGINNKGWEIYKDDKGRRKYLKHPINKNKIVTLLNIRAHIHTLSTGNADVYEALSTGYANLTFTDGGYYESVVAVCPDYNMQFLSTDFWKHGLAGIIDIADKIYPTYWYGKQHPFEFEFVVRDAPDAHKIFDNLIIISNKAEPESFHYEIIGECYDFAKDKKNMYIRQEATKELYQYNGSDVVFDENYSQLESEHRPLKKGDDNPEVFEKSTIFPLYYRRLDTINEIEDSYHLYDGSKQSKDFSALAGAEIVRYDDLDEYRIWNHTKAVNMASEDLGLLRGNMIYKEDKWNVLINPLNYRERNESKEDWKNKFKLDPEKDFTYNLVPAELNLFKDESKIPSNRDDAKYPNKLELPEDWERNIISWKEYRNKEAKIKDKFMKVRIRYSGKDLAIISAIKTIYSISYA